MCSEIFPSKRSFLEHSSILVNGAYQCCKCKATFRLCNDLYDHFNTHRSLQDSADTEEVVLKYDDNEVVVQQNAHDTNELLYILDDSACVNEVVIEGEQPNFAEESAKTVTKGGIEIVNFEHGYVMSADRYIEEEEDESGNIILRRKVIVPKTGKTVFSQPKPRTPQPKKRHEVPDFSATNYAYIEANEEVEVPHYKCLRCEQLFINKFGFYRHIEKGKCYINNCDVCTATFSKNIEFFKHYIAEHTDRAICNFCFRTFMYEKNVKEHMLRHLDQFRHRCEDCNKGFYTVREYRNHYKNRHMGIRHKCEVCGRSFADEYYFKRHIATHAKANKITVLEYAE